MTESEDRESETVDIEPYTEAPDADIARAPENGLQDDEPDPEFLFEDGEPVGGLELPHLTEES